MTGANVKGANVVGDRSQHARAASVRFEFLHVYGSPVRPTHALRTLGRSTRCKNLLSY